MYKYILLLYLSKSLFIYQYIYMCVYLYINIYIFIYVNFKKSWYRWTNSSRNWKKFRQSRSWLSAVAGSSRWRCCQKAPGGVPRTRGFGQKLPVAVAVRKLPVAVTRRFGQVGDGGDSVLMVTVDGDGADGFDVVFGVR